MAQNSAFVDEFDLDIRLWDGGSSGSLSEQFPSLGAHGQMSNPTLCPTCITCPGNITCNLLCRRPRV
jgi:hypothetical protein